MEVSAAVSEAKIEQLRSIGDLPRTIAGGLRAHDEITRALCWAPASKSTTGGAKIEVPS
ncbi:hypothetical protein PM082_018136 [Marasmius tenuissimus]|nr:hypothetical protein PM082_018136 [Marasmius tenuissimus]